MTDDLTLYHVVPTRSSIAHWMLEEVGRPYRLHVLDGKAGETRSPEFLAINPMGKVPVLSHGDAVVCEAAAICCHLADAFPAAGLAMPVGDPRRGPYLKWLFFGPSCLEPALIDLSLKREPGPRGALGYGDYDTVISVLEAAVAPGPYLFGETFTAADVVIGSGIRWGMQFDGIPRRPAFAAYVDRLMDRPALRRAMAQDEALMADRNAAD